MNPAEKSSGESVRLAEIKSWGKKKSSGACGLNLAFCGANNYFKWSQYLPGNNSPSLKRQHLRRRLIHFINMLTRVPECGYEGLMKAVKQNFNTFPNGPLVFPLSLSLLECFLKVFNLHPNAVPLFNLIYNADTEGDKCDGASSAKKGKGRDGGRGGRRKNIKTGKNYFTFAHLSYELSW